ncbi:MAG TPA: hypothetical protein PLT87_09200 [Spirochaetales bacterium]|nr:hypothetical protein [Spirochaetales bacterium]
MSRIAAIAALFFCLGGLVFGQASGGQQGTPLEGSLQGSAILSSMSELQRKTLSLDIAVSTYYELIDMARQYGLSTDGNSEALKARLYAFFGLKPPQTPSVDTVVTIEGASALQYFSLQETSDKMIQLTGPLTISVKTSDGFVHTIIGNEIIFDRDKNIVQAKGSIKYVRKSSDREDDFSGESLLVDLDDYSGFFIDGMYNLEPSGQTSRAVILHFGTLLKRASDVVVMGAGQITACDEPLPHYHLTAKKVWLFENGDWAFSGATLYIGTVPVLWLPFFFYPADELVFHPVIGYRTREGAFVQTTTYLLGSRGQTQTTSALTGSTNAGNLSNSISNASTLLGGSTPTRRQGVFLRHNIFESETQNQNGTGQKTSQNSGNSLRLLADAYTSLGLYVGTKGDFLFSENQSLSFQIGIGESRSVFYESSGFYSPLDVANNYASVWNRSNFLGLDLPFRFGVNVSYKYQTKATWGRASIAVDMPLFSDPYFEQDFYRRTEPPTMLSGIETQNATTIGVRSSMTDSLKSSLSWQAASASQGALLSSFQISRLGAQIIWNTKSQSSSNLDANQRRMLAVDPQRSFFYPDSVKFLDTALSANGTIFNYQKNTYEKNAGGSRSTSEHSTDEFSSGKKEAKAPKVSTPESHQRDFSNLSYRLDWSSGGSLGLEDKFYSVRWATPEDINGMLYYFLVGWRVGGRLDSRLGLADDLVVVKNSVEASSQNQTRPYFYDDRTHPTTVHPYVLTDYQYKLSNLKMSNSLLIYPFAADSLLANSSISYSLSGIIFKYAYSGLTGSGASATPVYQWTWIDWNSSTITDHLLAATLNFSPKSRSAFRQSLNFSATLPPEDSTYVASYTLANSWLQAKLKASIVTAEIDDTIYNNTSLLSAGITLGGGSFPLLNSEFRWNLDTSEPDLSDSSLSYRWFRARFIAKNAKGYAYQNGSWILDGTEYFRPYQVGLSLSPSLTLGKASAFQFKTDANLNYSQNLIKFTESSLSTAIGFTVTSSSGTSLSFKTESLNKASWRYWPGIFPASTGFNPADYYKNIFTDIVDSLAIWDTSRLYKGMFKLKSLALSLSQDLHDWNLEAKLGMDPLLVSPSTGRPYYKLDFSFSILVTWKDIPELKSSVAYSGGAFSQ